MEDNVLEPIVQAIEPNVEPAVEPAVDTTSEPAAELTEQEPAEQTSADNSAFAARRREQEAQARNKAFRELVGGITNPDTNAPFTSEAEWLNWKSKMETAQRAKAVNLDETTFVQLEKTITEHIKQSDPDIVQAFAERDALRRAQMEQVFENDLKSIKKAYPDELAKNISELGEDYLRLCAQGVSPLVAYEAVRAQSARKTRNPSMGDISAPTAQEKTYFSRDEVQKMSPEEVEKNYDTIRTSMAKW